MKKALIISYHYPPMDVIAARRAEAYALFLSGYGIHPTILTHRWEKVNVVKDIEGKVKKYDWKVWKNPVDVVEEHYNSHDVIRVPLYQSRLQQSLIKASKVPVVGKLVHLLAWSAGHLELAEIGPYFSRRQYLLQHLQVHKYDVIIGIFSPHTDVRLAYEMGVKFKTSFVIDYRDLWDNSLLFYKHSMGIGQRLRNAFCRMHHSRWLKAASFFTTVSQPVTDKIKALCNVNQGYRVTNGFEATVFGTLQKRSADQFMILHGGTLYDAQDISKFIAGVKHFLSRLKEPEKALVRIVFLAIRSNNKKKQLESDLPKNSVECIDWIPRSEAIQMMKDASILFYPCWVGQNGVVAGKLFEYLGAGNTIMAAPSDNGVVEELLSSTNAGVALNTSAEVSDFLYGKFMYWKENGFLEYAGLKSEIAKYSREYQVGIMASLIKGNA